MATHSSHLFPSSPFNSLLVLRQLKNSKQLPFEKFKSFLSLFRLPPHPHPFSLVRPSRTTQNKLNIISTKLSSVFFSSPFSLPSFPVSSKYLYSSSSPLQPTCSRRRLIWPAPATPTLVSGTPVLRRCEVLVDGQAAGDLREEHPVPVEEGEEGKKGVGEQPSGAGNQHFLQVKRKDI